MTSPAGGKISSTTSPLSSNFRLVMLCTVRMVVLRFRLSLAPSPSTSVRSNPSYSSEAYSILKSGSVSGAVSKNYVYDLTMYSLI